MNKQKKNSIIEEAYEDAKALEMELKENARDILSVSMKGDLEELIKESLEDDVEDVEDDIDDVEDDVEGIEGIEDDMGDDFEGDEDDIDIDSLADDDTDDDIVIGGQDDVIDMTQSPDEDVLDVFAKMGPNDGIIVTRDTEGNIDLETPENTYKIVQNRKGGNMNLGVENDLAGETFGLGGEEEMAESKNSPFDGVKKTKSKNSPFDGKTKVSKNAPFDTKNRVQAVSESEVEPIYEIDLDELEDELDEMFNSSEQEMEENKVRVNANRYRTTGNNQNAGTYTDGKRQTRGAQQNESKQIEQYKKLIEAYKRENAEYKNALKDFKTKLQEVAVFNSNLAYATRLFTENATTKKEKLNILRRFDGVKTLKESKDLFVTLQGELGSNSVIKESKKDVDEVINKAPKSGAATQLHESKIYEDPKFMRSLDIMKKIN